MTVPLTPRRWRASSQAEIAEFFGVALQTLKSSWLARGCPLEKTTGGYDLSAIAQWRMEYLASKRPKNENAALIDAIVEPGGEDWKDRWLRAKALLSESQLEELDGSLVDISEISELLSRMARLICDGIRRLESEHGADVADVMRTPLERFREELQRLHAMANEPSTSTPT